MIEEIKKEIEDKIKHLEKLMKPKKGVKPYGLEFETYNNSLLRYKEFIEILDKYEEESTKEYIRGFDVNRRIAIPVKILDELKIDHRFAEMKITVVDGKIILEAK